MPGDQGPREMSGDEAQAVHNLFHWASSLALPSSEFAVAFDETAAITPGKLLRTTFESLLTFHRNQKSPRRDSPEIHVGGIAHSDFDRKGDTRSH